ncbi:MFS transporter [Leptolyngbya sp. FACHB-261]|uniref:MFS transporter n=1 Tax=Leptolyngbya sp. FACHB-261 TaxID=2692806 RepID=UPI00168887FF|nr:MFS transporter [Leptolyngbya sp. FACHB-261]MBD2101256.1 MFS transporter [Leptolyngbya sp. FACHB-261]
MFGSLEITWKLASLQYWLAQVPVDNGVVRPEDAALVYSGPQFFIALIAGIVLAFALQLLLTNLSVALGISALGNLSHSDSSDHDHDSSGSLGGTIKKVGLAVGLWTLVTVTLALFVACLLAVKLSLIASETLGAIVGLVIWAAYFMLLIVVSSSTVGSLVGSVVNTATSTFQAIVGTAAAALGGKAVNDQVVSTAEAAAAAVGRQLRTAVDPISIRENLEDYLATVRRPELDMQSIRGDFERLLSDADLKAPGVRERLGNINRQTFVDLVRSRTDLSKRDVDKIADQLEVVWRQVVGQQPKADSTAELLEYLRSANAQQLKSDELSRRLDQVVAELRNNNNNPSNAKPDEQKSAGLIERAMQFGTSSLMGIVMGRTDLSDFDVEKILGQLQVLRGKVSDQVGDKIPGLSSGGTVAADVENYLVNSYSWKLNRESVEVDFPEVLYDPEADPGAVRAQIERLNRRRFVELLNQRGDMTPERVASLADQLEGLRTSVLTRVQAQELEQQATDLRTQVEQYLSTANRTDLLTQTSVQPSFRAILSDPNAEYEQFTDRLRQFDRNTLTAVLTRRNDLSLDEVNQVANYLEDTRNQVLREAEEIHFRSKSEAEALRIRVESYLRNTGKDELSPDGIKRDVQKLLEDPQAGASALRRRLSQFDRSTLVQLLSQRQDLSEQQINQTIDQVESVRDNILHGPQKLAGKAQDQVDQVTSTLAEYLRNTGKDALNPEGIQRDLQTLLHDPKQGASALRSRLSQVDRDTLVKLLSQRQDLSEDQVNQIIDQVQSTIRSLVRAPRRLASRAQNRVMEFESELENYLRNTNKEELNPEGIKRDLQLLLSNPRAGAYNLGERLGSVDRSTVVSLLSQRSDMSEEEANRIFDQIESVRTQFVEQVRSIQSRIQSAIDSVFERIRTYLNSLERPELNYDGIRRDLRTLFDDPQAGFDALRSRLSQVDRGTLVALLSSREDISEADANRLMDQIEGARTSVLQRAERLQLETQQRLADVKRQAQKQAEETRKAAASAAWWLFGTALVSAIASAGAGILAAR